MAKAPATARNTGQPASRSAGTTSRASPAAAHTTVHGRGPRFARRAAAQAATAAGTAARSRLTPSPSASTRAATSPAASAAHSVTVVTGAGAPPLTLSNQPGTGGGPATRGPGAQAPDGGGHGPVAPARDLSPSAAAAAGGG